MWRLCLFGLDQNKYHTEIQRALIISIENSRPRLIRRFQKRRREKRETIHLSGSTAEESKFGSFFSFRKKRGDEIKASQEVREQEKSLPVEFDSNDEAVEQGGVDPSAFIATERYSTLPSVAPEAPTTHSGQMERVEEEESKMPEEGQISSGIGNVDNEEPSNPGQLSRDKVVYQTRRASDGLMLSLVAERVPSLRESARDMT